MSHPGSPYHENEACAKFASFGAKNSRESQMGAKFAPGERVDLIAATRGGRAAIGRALSCEARTSELRVLLYVVVELVSWSRLSSKMPLAQIAGATKLHPHTVGRCLKAWHDRGVLQYEPARREGEYGVVHLEACEDPVELIAERERAPRVEMRDVWVGMRDVSWRGMQGGPAALRVLLVLIAQTACWSRVELRASQVELATAAGCSQAQVRRAISWLAQNDVVRYAPGTGHSCSKIRFGREDEAQHDGVVDHDAVVVHDPVVIHAALNHDAPGHEAEARVVHERYAPEDESGALVEEGVDDGVDNSAEEVHGATPGCRHGARPRSEREHVVLPPSELLPRLTPAGEGFIEELRRRSGVVVPPGVIAAELLRLHRWGREELLAAVLTRPLPATLHSPGALIRSRLRELDAVSPSEQLAAQREQQLEERTAARQAAAEAEARELAELEPYLREVDSMPPERIEEAVCAIGGGVLALWNRGRSTTMVRAMLADELRARAVAC